jgi:hypothetical protein
MTFSSNGDDSKPPTLSERLSGMFIRPGQGMGGAGRPRGAGETGQDPNEILPPSERRAAMRSLSAVEVKWSKAGLALAALLGVIFSAYLRTAHSDKTETVIRHGKKVKEAVPLSTSWLLLGIVVLVFCAFGAVALVRRKRTLLAFCFFIIGFAFTQIFFPVSLAAIFLGGWLLLRAYRIQKFGTPNAKVAARQAAARPPRRERKQSASAPVKPTGYKPPTANKRYTPKAAPRKKVAKPTE